MPEVGAHAIPDEDTLREVAGHVWYEVEQMRRALTLIRAKALADGHERWLLMEAGLIHARCLVEFLFYPPPLEMTKDARAAWYVPDWDHYKRKREFAKHLGTSATRISTAVNKRVFHLTADRLTHEHVHFEQIAPALEPPWRTFHHHLPERWKQHFPE